MKSQYHNVVTRIQTLYTKSYRCIVQTNCSANLIACSTQQDSMESKNHQLYYSKTERYEVQQLTRRTALYTSWHGATENAGLENAGV